MKGYTYALISLKDNKSYVGSTVDLDTRIIEHNAGKCVATRDRRPLKLVYYEGFDSIQLARKRERYFKNAAGRRALKKIFENLKNGGE
ncbi:MAG: GIY-YIG nuclease family protein [bacterium]|nr:GIY-YIG nuclease family protein [bacterium]